MDEAEITARLIAGEPFRYYKLDFRTGKLVRKTAEDDFEHDCRLDPRFGKCEDCGRWMIRLDPPLGIIP